MAFCDFWDIHIHTNGIYINIYLYKCTNYYCDFDNHRIFNKKELLTDVAVLTHRAKGWPDLAGSQSSKNKLKIDGPASWTLR